MDRTCCRTSWCGSTLPGVRVDDPHAYTRRALARAAQNRWRWRRRHPETELAGHDSPSPDPSEDLARRDHLLAALTSLPAGQRAVVVLRHYEGLSELETAAVLGCSPGTVKSQASRGLARLRSLLAQPVVASVTGEGEGR